jgi:alpha-tubulin suppressor-like RCC1 family protein
LGNNTKVLSLVPVTAVATTGALSGVAAIAAGLNHSLALKGDGSVLSWGQNTAGQLGINSTVDAQQATAVTALSGHSISAISAGPNHSLALRSDGTVYAWGANESGQLGDGKTVNLKVPTPIAALSNIVALAAGAKHSLALSNDGTVWAWGANASGQLGDKTATARLVPVQVAGLVSGPLTGVRAIAANGEHSLALLSDGTVVAWGSNTAGQLGYATTGTSTFSKQPKQVGTLAGVVAIAAGTAHSTAVLSSGVAQNWGGNWQGQLGDGTRVGKPSPVPIAAVDLAPLAAATPVPSIAAGSSHTLKLEFSGAVFGWGSNEFGQVGDGTTVQRKQPVAASVLPASAVRQVAAGDAHSLALLADKSVAAWGFNGYGQLGDNTTTQSLLRVSVGATTGALSSVGAIAAGLNHSLALKEDGSVLSWGQNTSGQLGINSTLAAKQATAITTLAGRSIIAIASGHNHSLALRHDGAVYAWGINESGQLGDGKTASLKVPTQISALANVIALAAGAKHSLALRNDGTVWAWGANTQSSQLNAQHVDL